jgi:hypothetical protein
MKQVYFFLMIALIACQPSSDTESAQATEPEAGTEVVSETSPEQDEKGSGRQNYAHDDFKDFYRDLFISMMDNKESDFNTFLNPKQGLYIIDSKGALPAITNVSDISTYQRMVDNKSIFSVDEATLGYEMLEEGLPKVDCDSEGFYTKRGSYTANTNDIIKSEIWKITNLSKEDQEQFATYAETISKTCVNTGNYTYYFSFIDGSWFLTVIDLRKPCEA